MLSYNFNSCKMATKNKAQPISDFDKLFADVPSIHHVHKSLASILNSISDRLQHLLMQI